MSADLFAAFGCSPQTSAPQQNRGTSGAISYSAAPTANDPFSLLASNPPPQPQSSQQSTQWPPFQRPTTGQPEVWRVAPVDEPQKKSGGWGDTSGLTGLNGFQNQTTSSPAAQHPSETEEDDDGWGDFEVAPPKPPPQPAAPVTMIEQPRSRVIRASTIDMLSNKLVDLGMGTTGPEPWQERPSWEKETKTQQPRKPARNPDPNVLFDADFEAENGANGDDEFGDFETGAAAHSKPAVDLLGWDPAPAPPPRKQPPGLLLSNAALQAKPNSYPEAPKSPYGSFQERKPEALKQLQVQPPTDTKVLREASQASPSPITAWPSVEPDGFGNQWEEFKDLPDTVQPAAAKIPSTKSKPASTPNSAPAPDWEWQDWGTQDQPTSRNTHLAPQPPPSDNKPGPPPTNIPPPSIFLSYFPQLLGLASSSLLKPLLTLPPSSPSYQAVLSSPATLTFLKGYLALATVAARVIAGRKHRWHRDRFLAQGMSISAAPVAGGGGRGMKLAAVDKAQAAREDGEAGEVVEAWKRQVGRLRAVVAGVNAAQKETTPLLRVPEMGMDMVVTTAKGAPTAPRVCVVCGLKREERVAKVDFEVEDCFGEWWVEFWGHRECRNFWVQHERELRQR
ncbi:hypothetical protein VTK56DRAFT_8613 [Thermocarpiscus australiensis]